MVPEAVNSRILSMTSLALALAACAPNLCQRKAAHFERCAGSMITYAEPLCEENLARCSDGEKARIEAYVQCLEAQNECSLAANNRCGAQFPGAVNLTCKGG